MPDYKEIHYTDYYYYPFRVVGTAAISIGVIIWQYMKTWRGLKDVGGDVEASYILGMMLTLAGLFATSVLYMLGFGFWSGVVGLIISVMGLLIALIFSSPIYKANPSIEYIDEMIDAAILGISASEFIGRP